MPIRRTIKNVVKNYSDAQVKVREATSNDPWNPSSTLMSEIADYTYNVVAYTEIMQIVWKRLNDHGKNWRHVYKSLVLLDYIVKTGSEKVAQQCRENIYVIQTLKDFQYMDDAKDQGVGIREKAKQLVALLKDEERLKNERTKALKAKERFAQNASSFSSNTTSPTALHTSSSYGDNFTPRNANTTPVTNVTGELDSARPSNANEEELQLQLAIAMSKEEAEEDERKRKGDDVKLHMAMEESKKELEKYHTTRHNFSDQPSDLIGINLHNTSNPKTGALGDDDDDALSPKFKAYLHKSNSNTTKADLWNEKNNGKDPWGSTEKKQATADPWGSDTQNDPWNTKQNNGVNDPWGAELSSDTEIKQIDDFDLLSTRTVTTDMPNDKMTSNSFNLMPLDQDLPPKSAKKSPENFLGEHSKLVNMDNLVSRPTASPVNTNPFAALAAGAPVPTTSNSTMRNPFAQQTITPRVPMNQMGKNVPNMHFGMESNQMPAPLVPLGGSSQISSNTNPFL